MNERIKELAHEVFSFKYKTSPYELNPSHRMDHLHKFAELIIRECVRYFNEDYQRDFDTLWREDLTKGIKEHFGVEESKGWVCPKCGIDRTKDVCPKGHMTDRELMQKVLEKLVFFAHMKSVSEDTMRLIADLRERLAQPELVQFKCTVVDDDHPDGVPLSKWGRHSEHEPFCYHDGRNIVGKEYADHSDVFPLYTSPPASKPLTDEQRRETISNAWNEYLRGEGYDSFSWYLSQAIEAAHGIKGDA